MTQFYIGCKQVMAWDGSDGTKAVKYEDGQIFQSPLGPYAFDKAYLPMGEDADGSTVTQEMVEDFIASYKIHKIGDKTTLVSAVLRNGFVVNETSSCVDPANYDEELGKNICMNRIENKVLELLDFMLQWARNGLTPKN